MNMQITPSILRGTVDAVPSKSDFHRALICSALSEKDSSLIIDGDTTEDSISSDIEATMECLKAAGARIDVNDNTIHISPIDPGILKDRFAIDCGESGSTLRFILPVLACFGKKFTVTGQGRLPERPIKELMDQLKQHGCSFSSESIPFTISGKLESGEFSLPGNISSQYISGLLFALPLLKGDSSISVTTDIESASYIDMTIKTLKKYGVNVSFRDRVFYISGDQNYRVGKDYRIEGDWSNSAFWLCAGSISEHGITCRGLDRDTLQPDSKILEILENIGADIQTDESGITVKKGLLQAVTVDASEIPDLVPVLSVLLSICEGRSRIINAGRLRIKESDRLRAMAENLKILGAQIEETEDGLEITGKKNLRGGRVEGHNDHRIVMAMTIASAVCEDYVVIEGTEAVNKSYRNFFDDFRNLEGVSNVI